MEAELIYANPALGSANRYAAAVLLFFVQLLL